MPCRSLPGTPAYDYTKSDFLDWWGRGDILVDDSPENIAGAQRIGISGILYGQPWNTGSRLPLAALTSELLKLA